MAKKNRQTVAKVSLQSLDRKSEREKKLASVVLRAIDANFGVSYFTREDLLQLPVLSHVSTISRYGLVREAITLLFQTGAVRADTRTMLRVAGHVPTISPTDLYSQFKYDIDRLVEARPQGERFNVMDIVRAWKSRADLTTNVKRTAVRSGLRTLAAHGVIMQSDSDSFDYVRCNTSAKETVHA